LRSDEKREHRLSTLFQNALNKKYTSKGKFEYGMLVNDAKAIGVSIETAKDYANVVIKRLEKRGHLK